MKKVKTPPTKVNPLISALQTEDTTTHNGAVSHSTTGTKVLDLFGLGGSARSKSSAEVTSMFAAAYAEDKQMTLKVLFYLADVREGQGERKFFRTCYNWLASNDLEVASKLLGLIPEYTRYDNILETLEHTPLFEKGLEYIACQLRADMTAKTPSLCAKWAPSEQASSKVTKRLANKLRLHMRMTQKDYRKMLSGLRKEIDVVERKMCANKWTKIDYEGVPSRASSIYRNAFKKHDEDGYTKYIGQVETGEKKINASVLYPYDIVREYTKNCYGAVTVDRTLEAQWKALPDYLADTPHNGLVIADVSSSMNSSRYYGGTNNNVTPINVAVSLAIYFAERNTGAFNNHFMIFSNIAKLLTLTPGTSLAQKVRTVLGDRPVANTNIQAAFDLILDKAMKHNISPKDMPSTLYIVSDMQFDYAIDGNTNFQAIKTKYENAGYKLPGIVFWNVNSYSDVPIKFDDKGTCLVSGCSPTILKSVVGGKVTTPYDMMCNTVLVPRYDPVTV